MEPKMQGKRGRMKLGAKHYARYSLSYVRNGRKKSYQCEIEYNDYRKNFYFFICKGDYIFNSYCSNMVYGTEEECLSACEAKIDELVKGEHK